MASPSNADHHGTFRVRAQCVDHAAQLAGRRETQAEFVLRKQHGSRRDLTADAERLLRLAWDLETVALLGPLLPTAAARRVFALSLPAHVYYALFNAFCAVTEVQGDRLDKHSSLRVDFARNRCSRLPEPWSITLAGDPDEGARQDLQGVPVTEYTPDESLQDAERRQGRGFVLEALRITRRWQHEDAVLKRTRQTQRAKRADSDRNTQPQPASLRPSTLLDFLYELRCRASYDSADEFSVDLPTDDVERFSIGMVGLLDSGLILAETQIASMCGASALRTSQQRYLQRTSPFATDVPEPLNARWGAVRLAHGTVGRPIKRLR